MTPAIKAIELYSKYYNRLDYKLSEENLKHEKSLSKEFALLAVDEIIKSRKEDKSFDDTLSSISSEYYTPHPMYLTYWNLVKEEINKI